MLRSVTVVLPNFMRKFASLDELVPSDEIVASLPPSHAPIRAMWSSDWLGFARPTTVAGFFASRAGTVCPPWTDGAFLDLIESVPTRMVRGIESPPLVPREWVDPPPHVVEAARRIPARPLQTHPTGLVIDKRHLPAA